MWSEKRPLVRARAFCGLVEERSEKEICRILDGHAFFLRDEIQDITFYVAREAYKAVLLETGLEDSPEKLDVKAHT
jgi:hypothetical protein